MNNQVIRSINSRRVFWCLAITLTLFQAAVFAGIKTDKSSAKKNIRTESQQKVSLWRQVSDENTVVRGRRLLIPEKYKVFRLNQRTLDSTLAVAPLEFSEAAKQSLTIMELPMPDGRLARFRIEESPVLSTEIAAQFPDWKSYQGYGIDDPTATLRFDWTATGFHAQILSPTGTVLIDPYQENDRENYIVYYKRDVPKPDSAFHCDFDNKPEQNYTESLGGAPSFSNGVQIRTYRLAMAATGEYTAFFRQVGDTDAQAQTRAFNAIVVTINRVTGIYRRDFAVSFTFVSGTNLVYPNAATDPYANTSGDLSANQTNIDAVIGNANYDIGHLVGTGGGGVAGLGVTCRTGAKAVGLTGSPSPVGDPFDIDYVAHEMGHQMGGNHTFNSINDNCNGNRNSGTAFEPGSAATIMGYAGICGAADLQRNSIDNFHIGSMTEAINYKDGTGATCGTLSGANAVPVIAPLTDYTIPFRTPFVLNATATDADANPLTYSWEEYDANLTASNYPAAPDDDDTTLLARPLFRSYSPSTANFRDFPSLPFILNNSNEPPVNFTGTSPTGILCSFGTCVTGEDLPSIARTMNFRVAVRDGQGGAADAGMILTVVNTVTPFQVTAQNTASSWGTGSTRTVTWDVSTTNAAPINTANVKISLSTDGGQTFPTVLLASTPNDGSEAITVPNTPTTQARIKVEAVGNIFFDINDVNFAITVGPTAAAVSISGRVILPNDLGLTKALVTLTDSQGDSRTMTTGKFGVFRFGDVTAGEIYILSVSSKRYTFAPQIVTANADLTDLVFTPQK
jgi:Metallo-peptidase family M12B Reprolysin-like